MAIKFAWVQAYVKDPKSASVLPGMAKPSEKEIAIMKKWLPKWEAMSEE